MAKRLDITLDEHQANQFLQAVRVKRDVITLWMNAIKAFLVQQPADEVDMAAELSVVVSKMSRLFLGVADGRKIFSIAFPFTVRTDGPELQFFSREGILIDSRMSSVVLSLVHTDGVLELQDPYSFLDPILTAMEADQGTWSLFRELMLAEDGYVRYDWDTERVNGHLHPEHHLDFCYSGPSTFKVGLQKQLGREEFLSILDLETDCHYLHSV